MASSVPAGRLSIEIVAEVARLQQDLDKAKRAVKAMSGDIARDTKAANDNIAGMGRTFARTGQQVTASAGAQRAAMSQLSFQLGDIAQGFAMGTPPMTIFAQQSGQVIQAVSMMTNTSKGFIGFLAGPWGMAISAATVLLVPLISRLFEAEEATKEVEFASYKLGDAQGILGRVMDMTTGKINTQKDALLALARAQLIAGQIKARSDMASARSELSGMAANRTVISGGFGGGLGISRGRDASGDVVEAFMEGSLSTREAISSLESLRKTGYATEKQFLDAAKAVTDFGVAQENLKVFQDAEKALGGDAKALAQFLDPAKARKGREAREKKQSGPTAAEIEAQFARELAGWTQRNLRAQIELATSVEERVELEQRSIEWDRRSAVAEIESDKHYSDLQKQRLIKMIEANNDFRLEILERQRIRDLEKQAADLAQVQFDQQRTLYEQASSMADTQAERKRLALEILALEQQYRRQQLEALVASQATTDAERKRAQTILDGLAAIEAGERAVEGRANETGVEKYLRDVNMTKDQMDEAFDQITIDGLDAFNNGLVDAIVNFRSLGDVARTILSQILADMLRLQIQQAIIGPLAGMLGLAAGGGASPSSGLVGSVLGAFAENPGLFARGTMHAPPGMAIVGEDGPEFVDFRGGERVYNNRDTMGMLGGGTQVHRPTFVFPGVTSAREAREAGAQAARRYKRTINGPVTA